MAEMQDSLVLEPGRFAPTAEDRRRLRHLPVLGDATDGSTAQLIAATSVISVAKDHEILREGAKPSALLAVLSGRVALVSNSAHSQYAILDILDPLDIIMPATVLEPMAYPLSAVAIESSRIASIPLATVRAVMERDPALVALLTQSIAESWRRKVGQLKDQRLLSAPQRFAAYLMRLAGTRHGRTSFDIGEDRKTLASLLGMTPENLSRTIGQLREIGVVLNGRHVEIADVETVVAFSQCRGRSHEDETARRG